VNGYFCNECEEHFDTPDQYLSDAIPSCPYCGSPDICEVHAEASAMQVSK
jgi:hypothetical protein